MSFGNMICFTLFPNFANTPQNVFVLKFCLLGFCSKLFQHSASNDVRYSGFSTAKQWQGRFFVVLHVDTMGGFVSWYKNGMFVG